MTESTARDSAGPRHKESSPMAQADLASPASAEVSRTRRDLPPPDTAVIPLRHYGRTTFAVIAVLAVVAIGANFATNPHISWPVVGEYFANGAVLKGLLVTLEMALLSMVLGLILATVLAVMRLSDSKVLHGIAGAYVFFFRGIPMIVLLIFMGNLGLFLNIITIGIPFTDIVFFSTPTQKLVTPFVASVLSLVLVAAAYLSEIVRGGLLAVNKGQRQAAQALGLNGGQALRHIVLPQALRVIIPPLGNEFVNTLKATALVSVIAGGDLLTMTQSISGVNYKVIEMLLVASIWYMLVIGLWSIVQLIIERKTAEK